MTDFTAFDTEMMAAAIRLAERGRYSAHPNPRVGCVIAVDGKIVGQGWHAAAGEAHAEINALADAGRHAKGATAYVSLEPCCHEGRTGPCTTALSEAGVSRVVAAMTDPYPEVAGTGMETLSAHNIETSVGLLEGEARRLNAGYLSRIEAGRPRVTLKIAASLDGATALQDGASRWITSIAARRDVQRWRAQSGAILTGIGTVLADDPSLTVRDVEVREQPLRVVLDSALRLPATAKLLALAGGTRVYCSDDSRRSALESAGADIVKLQAVDGRVDVSDVMQDLAALGINDVLVEAGPVLAGSLVDRGFIDRLVIYQAPHMMGSETRRMLATPSWNALEQRLNLVVEDTRRVGPDTRIVARPDVNRP